MKKIQILKLMNGETIIAEVMDIHSDITIIKDAMVLISLISSKEPEVAGISMHRWIPFFNDILEIKNSLIITSCNAPQILEKYYEFARQELILTPDLENQSLNFLADFNGIKQ